MWKRLRTREVIVPDGVFRCLLDAMRIRDESTREAERRIFIVQSLFPLSTCEICFSREFNCSISSSFLVKSFWYSIASLLACFARARLINSLSWSFWKKDQSEVLYYSISLSARLPLDPVWALRDVVRTVWHDCAVRAFVAEFFALVRRCCSAGPNFIRRKKNSND